MKYIELQKYLQKLKVFSTEDLKILDNNYDKSKTSKWIKTGYFKSIIRGFYLYSEIDINQSILFLAANKIYSPSYISLESAFNYYSIIPEQVFSITSVSTKKTINFDSKIGYFSYNMIKPNLFWGYKVVVIKDVKFLVAELEKAILDYFYLKSNIKDQLDFEGLRLNKELLNEKLDLNKLEMYSRLYESPVITKKVKKILTYLKNDTDVLY